MHGYMPPRRLRRRRMISLPLIWTPAHWTATVVWRPPLNDRPPSMTTSTAGRPVLRDLLQFWSYALVWHEYARGCCERRNRRPRQDDSWSHPIATDGTR